MKNVAKFEKVSFEQFKKDVIQNYYDISKNDVENVWNNIMLPRRATIGSAGYDFYFPFNDVVLAWSSSIVIPTGLKCKIIDEWWLGLFPKSSFGINYRVKLDDTISVIDADYYNCRSNEGHIFVKLTNNDKLKRPIKLSHNKAYCQGIFLPYGLTDDDNTTEIRVGGLGSTNS